jgi:hypothetical protein
MEWKIKKIVTFVDKRNDFDRGKNAEIKAGLITEMDNQALILIPAKDKWELACLFIVHKSYSVKNNNKYYLPTNVNTCFVNLKKSTKIIKLAASR